MYDLDRRQYGNSLSMATSSLCAMHVGSYKTYRITESTSKYCYILFLNYGHARFVVTLNN